MSELSTDIITWLGWLVLVVLLGSPRFFEGLKETSPEHESPEAEPSPGAQPAERGGAGRGA